MSTSKKIDKIAIAAMCIAAVITVLFMFGESLGITAIHKEDDEGTNKMFTDNDLNADWDTTDAIKINLNGDSADVSGSGAYFSEGTLYIACAGKYVLSGDLDGSIHIDANSNDKIWIMLDGVDITSQKNAPVWIEQADKVFLTLKENTQNVMTFESDNEEIDTDGSIFSRDDLTINGKGKLVVNSSALNGIVCNDTLAITGGDINISAKNDAVHAHDAIKICNAALTILAGDDALHAGNDDETAFFYIESGSVDIKECYEGIEANDVKVAGGTIDISPSDDGINACGSAANSQIAISGGKVSIVNKNGRDADGLDSNGSINITGGNVFISVSGSGTNNAIDYGSENGGKCTISGGSIVACGSSQMAEGPEGDSKQAFIMQNASGSANDKLTLLDSNGKIIISKKIPCAFTSVLVSTPKISVGDTVTLKIGTSTTKITVSNTAQNGMGGMSPGGEKPQGEQPQGDPPQGDSPQGDSPQGDPPQGDQPQGDPPQGDPPQGGPPQGDPPQGDSPQGGPPQANQVIK